MTKKMIALTILIAMLIVTVITGCRASSPDSPLSLSNPQQASVSTTASIATQPAQDVAAVSALASNMHFSVVIAEDLHIESQYEAEVALTVTEYTDGSFSMDLAFTLAENEKVDLSATDNTITVQHEELGLPYYCAKASIYQPELDGYVPCDFAVDIDMGYLIFKESTSRMSYYIVASTDPTVDPLQIAEHFSMFFQIYDHTHSDTSVRTNLYFDLYGTWISEDGEILGTMPFYINGKLPEEYADGSTVDLELNFIWPKSFAYRNEGTLTCTGSVNIFEDHHGHPNFHGTGTLFDSETNRQIPFAFNIFPMDSTVIIYMNGQYLIGIPREMSQMDAMLNYYKAFIFTDLE